MASTGTSPSLRAHRADQVKRLNVHLLPLDDELIERLLQVAIADAGPEEVMPPVADAPGWTPKRRETFRTFHRQRTDGLSGPYGEVHFAVLIEGEIVGSARLARRSDPKIFEAGTWLARGKRNLGIGSAMMKVLLQKAAAAGAESVVAETTAANHAAAALLRRLGAVLEESPDGHIRARLSVPSDPSDGPE
jgi:RimJ/RimL family protein N-acetyltransferase